MHRIAYYFRFIGFLLFFNNGNLIAFADVNNLVDDVCELLLHGHSADNVIAMIGDRKEYDGDIQKLVNHIQDLLNKKKSKEEVMKESEKIYARENLGAKGKATFLALKIIAILVVVYMVYSFFSWNFKKPKIPISRFEREGHRSHGDKKEKQPLPYEQEIQTQISIPCGPGDSKECQPISNEQIEGEHSKIHRIKCAYIASNLELAIEQLVAYEKSIGLVPDMTQHNEVEPRVDRRGDFRLSELIVQQVEYEKKLGLVPITTPH